MFELMPSLTNKGHQPVSSTTASTPDLLDRMDRLFDEVATCLFQGKQPGRRDWVPAFDIYETDDTIILKADVPGVDPSELDISVNGDVLTVKGERKQEKPETNQHVLRLERRFGCFSRSMSLPSNVDGKKIAAGYKDGVLRLTIPKIEAAKPRRIEVDRH